ncbi:MAG TPA: hypothetical protein VI818_03455 [Candidatus Thermoplasmatota archaeon]|nr:hypothetical protein [Candidatus Thermoplasmatota archaeon]
MAKSFLSRFLHLEREAPAADPMSWNHAEALARKLAPKSNLVVPKARLSDAPPYPRSRLGRSRGALRQFRCHRSEYNLHIKEFEDHWVIHVDRWNPHLHAVRHILVDRGFKEFLHIAQLSAPSAVPTPVAA